MDMNSKVKQAVLQQLMDLMDEKMTDGLKTKSPKFAKIDIQSDDPKLAESLKDKVIEGAEDMSHELGEEPKMGEENSLDESSDEEDLERLRDLYSRLK